MANLKVTLNPKVTKKEVNGKTVNQIKVKPLVGEFKRDGILTIDLPADLAPWAVGTKTVNRAEFWQALGLGPDEPLEITETVTIRYIP